MKIRRISSLIIIWSLIHLTLVACSTPQPTSTQIPPTATSVPPTATVTPPRALLCEGVEGECVEFRFETESCRRVGPEIVSAGNITLIFSNYTEYVSGVDLEVLDEGKTWNDMLKQMGGLGDYNGSQPRWSVDVTGVSGLSQDEFRIKPKELTAGTYIAVCWTSGSQHDIFLADGGLVVED